MPLIYNLCFVCAVFFLHCSCQPCGAQRAKVHLLKEETEAMFSFLNFLNLALCKKKIPRHIKFTVHA